MSDSLFLTTLNKQKSSHTPIWLMRQAGRYLPEYRQVRAKQSSFWNMCLSPDIAAEITLQPIRRFGFDAAVIFSDILILPYIMGHPITFSPGLGPIVTPITNIHSAANIYNPDKLGALESSLKPVYDAIRCTKNLNSKIPIVGFVGGPFTLSMYALGAKKGNFKRQFASLQDSPELCHFLIQAMTNGIVQHCKGQIKAGVCVIQIFESFGNIIETYKDFQTLSYIPIRNAISRIKVDFPKIPIILYANNSNFISHYADIADFISIHHHSSQASIDSIIKYGCGIQGNLSPSMLRDGSREQVKKATIEILKKFKDVNHIFNLGHGIDKNTPIENVTTLIDTVRNTAIR